MLEAAQYGENCFLTLTYDDEHMPRLPDGRGNLEKRDLQNFMKHLRWKYAEEQKEMRLNEPRRIRFYACGEYGETTQRPHFHLALFNIGSCHYGNTRTQLQRRVCCPRCDFFASAWQYKGRVFAGSLEIHSAQYLAGYVTKKMTMRDDPRLDGRNPEFGTMSLRPGIGHSAMHEVASQLMKFNLDNSQADVPSALRHGSRLFPLGRYLRRSLRDLVGHEKEVPEAVKKEMEKEMLPVRMAARSSEEAPSLKQQIQKRDKGKIDRLIARHRIYKKRTTI